MKKQFKSIICIILTMLFSFSTAIASEEKMQIDWYGDYSEMELVINLKAPVNYIQNVTAVMYPKGAENSFDSYSRIDEITLDGKKESSIRFKIANDLTAPDGIYIVKLQGNGSYNTENNSAQTEVCIMTPYNVSQLLDKINGATDSTEGILLLRQCMIDMSAILQLSGAEESTDLRIKEVLSIRNNDYSLNEGKFPSLNDAEKAWKVSGLLEYLSNESLLTEMVEQEYTKLSDVLSVVMTDEDYTERKTDIYTNIINMRKLYNDGLGIKSIADAENLFNEAKAVSFVNASSVDELSLGIEKYISVFKIDDSSYSEFLALSSEKRKKVLRQLVNKNFTSAAAIKTAFNSALSGIDSSSGGSGGGGGGGGGSFGGSGDGVGSLGGVSSGAEILPENSTNPTGFSDLSSTHWAQSYINSLKDSGIISGYSDGKFYPDKSVKREEFVKMIILASDMENEDSKCEFSDVSADAWYFTYVASATSNGIINGIGDGAFGVGSDISREDVAVIVSRILEKKEIFSEIADKKEFKDNEKISEYALESVQKLASMGIINGFEDGTFNPKGSLTRAEAAKIISVINELIKK